MVTIRAARPDDLPVMQRLLEDACLPVKGVAEALESFLVAEDAGQIVGAVGLEEYGDYGLLRSAVVHPGRRGSGLGAELTERLRAEARSRGRAALFLLTTTAAEYFARRGFRAVSRAEVPAEVRQSAQFRGVCPASAVVMRADL